MKNEIPIVIDTLGRRLDWQARRLMAVRIPEPPWAGPLSLVLRHVTAAPLQAESRFLRIDGPVPDIELDQRGGEVVQRGLPLDSHELREDRTLAPEVQARLRDVVGPGAELLRVHDGEKADATARAHRADAVTIGRDVYFRQGRFRPRDPRGFGLLAHEATHLVQWLRPGAAWRRATGGALRDEEAEALDRERSMMPRTSTDSLTGIGRSHGSSQPAHHDAARSPSSSSSPEHATPAPAHRPMTAAISRETGGPAPASAPVDLDQLRRTLVRDLMRQLRAEFERGG